MISDFFQKIKQGKDKIQKYNEEKQHAKQHTPLAVMILNDALPLLATIAFVLLGILGGWWHPAWLVFLILPVYYMTVGAIVHRSPEMIPVAPIALLTYLALGCIGGLWHPYWAIFAVIPVYYITIAAVKGSSLSKILDSLVPILTVAAFVVLGITLNAWHPAWVVFFAIPLYFTVKGTISKYQNIQSESEEIEYKNNTENED